MKYTGSFEDLKAIVLDLGYIIDMAEQRGNAKQIRTRAGAIVNWFESTGTLQFQGKLKPKEKLEKAISAYIDNPTK